MCVFLLYVLIVLKLCIFSFFALCYSVYIYQCLLAFLIVYFVYDSYNNNNSRASEHRLAYVNIDTVLHLSRNCIAPKCSDFGPGEAESVCATVATRSSSVRSNLHSNIRQDFFYVNSKQ